MEARLGWPGLRPSPHMGCVAEGHRLMGELANFPLHHPSLNSATNMDAGTVMLVTPVSGEGWSAGAGWGMVVVLDEFISEPSTTWRGAGTCIVPANSAVDIADR